MALSGLPPVRAGRFFVYGVHDRGRAPVNTVNLRIEAGRGVRHRPSWHHRRLPDGLRRPAQGRGVRPGAGRRAPAPACWPSPRREPAAAVAVGTDIDPVSVRIARENAKVNAVRARFVHASGLAHRPVRAGAPYDLVFANILARPLVALASPIRGALKPGGAGHPVGAAAHPGALCARGLPGARIPPWCRGCTGTPGRRWCCAGIAGPRRLCTPPLGDLIWPMRQTFDETTDPSFGPKHVPLIRQAMAAQGLDGFVIPHEDEHQNEYLPAANDRLAWATGFTGSAGAAVILKDKAGVFVDGRYALQVRDQVDGGTVRDPRPGRGRRAGLSARPRPRPARPSATTRGCTAPTRWSGCARRRPRPARR